jgi:eukaryotic-like serine/threonine-protein kinase
MSNPKPNFFNGSKRFSVIKKLGEGGLGVVYSAMDKDLGVKVALKTVKDTDPESMLRLKNEFRSLQDLQHKNLISFGELFENNGEWFFSMELIEGLDFTSHIRNNHSLMDFNRSVISHETRVSPPLDTDLAQLQKSSKTDFERECSSEISPYFDEERLRDGLVQLSEGLMALHETERLHRDIKPGNIMVQPSGRVVLMDFGLVTASEQNMKSLSHFFPVGTSVYMSPEQAACKSLSFASDWYSVGVVLFEALTGKLPFDGTFASVVLEKQRSVAPLADTFVKDLPKDLMELCRDLLQFDPKLRPTGEEFIDRLKGHTASSIVSIEKSIPHGHLFIGRSKEIKVLHEQYSRFLKGEQISVLVHGASGLGKSELVRSFFREYIVNSDKTLVLSGRCYERESVSFKAFDQIIDSLSQLLTKLPRDDSFYVVPQNASLLTRVFPVLSRVEAMGYHSKPQKKLEDLQEIRSVAFQALRELFSRLSDRFFVVVYIDDFQWADKDSYKLLRALLQPPFAPKILFIAAQRTDQDNIVALEEVQHSIDTIPTQVTTVVVNPLTNLESIELSKKLVQLNFSKEEIEKDEIDAIVREGGGHPLFIHELVRHTHTLNSSQKREGAIVLDEALWNRISLLPAEQLTIIEIVAMCSAPISIAVLSEALDTLPGKFVRHIDSLRLENLIKTRGKDNDKRVEPFHDRIRETVIRHLSVKSKQEIHLKLALTLKKSGSVKPDTLAFHFEGAGELKLARNHFIEAAHLASNTLAFEHACKLFRKGINLWTEVNIANDPNLRKLWIDLASALANAGRGQESAHAYLKALPGSLASEAMDLHRIAGGLLMRAGHVEEGLHVMEKVLRDMKVSLPKQGWPTLLSLLWRRFLLRIRGLKFKEYDESQVSKEDLAQVDIFHSITDGMGIADPIIGADLGTRWVHAALNVGEPKRVLIALCREANYIAVSGKSNNSYHNKIIHVIKSLLKRVNYPVSLGYVEGANAYRHYMKGDWHQAYNYAKKSISVFEEGQSFYWEKAQMNFVVLWSLFYMGRLADMSKIGKNLLNDALDRDDLHAAMGDLLGLNNIIFVNMDGPEKAKENTDAIISKWSVKGYHLQHFWHLLSSAQLDFYNGEGVRAHTRIKDDWKNIKKSLLLLVPSVRNEALFLRARSSLEMARNSNGSSRAAFLKRAHKDTKRLSSVGLPWTKAFATFLHGDNVLLKGQDDQGIMLFKKAILQLEQQEMMLYVASAKYKLGNIIGGDEGDVLITEADAYYKSQNVSSPHCLSRMLF